MLYIIVPIIILVLFVTYILIIIFDGSHRPAPFEDALLDIEISATNCTEDSPDGKIRGCEGLALGLGYGPQPTSNIRLSKPLKQRFRQWSRAVLAQQDPETKIIPPELEEEGIELARAVKREKPASSVSYIPYDPDADYIDIE